MHSQNNKIVTFPSQKDTILIKEPNYQKYHKKLKVYLNNGYEIIIASCAYKKTRFGGTISYFAELKKYIWVVIFMNGIQREILAYLSTLSPSLEPLKKTCEQYINYTSMIDGDFTEDKNGNTLSFLEMICIGYNPCLYHKSYAFTLNKGINPSWLDIFYSQTNIRIPEVYAKFLIEMNGCHLFDLMVDGFTLLGLPPCKYYKENIKPYMVHDLDHSNIKRINNDDDWYFNYFDGFNIGYRSADFQDILVGYFIIENKIISASYGGKIENEYNNFTDFLENEILLAKNNFFKHEKLENLSKF